MFGHVVDDVDWSMCRLLQKQKEENMTPIRKRMLKAIKGKFTAKEADARIRGFLRRYNCPWNDNNIEEDCERYGGKICKAMFPKIQMVSRLMQCPCFTFRGGYEYVKKRANEALSEWH